MPPIAYFGIESSGLSLIIDLLILSVVVLYGSLVYWTYADARRRIVDPLLIGVATAASLFPFVGTIVYVILRPPEYLEDARERELEMQAAEARLYELDYHLCPHCDYRIERDFIRCPSCLRKLKERCSNCARPLDRAWTICPYCETEVPSAGPARRTGRRERTVGAGSPAMAPETAENELPASALEPMGASASRSRTGAGDAVRAPEPASRSSEPSIRRPPSSEAVLESAVMPGDEDADTEPATRSNRRSRSAGRRHRPIT